LRLAMNEGPSDFRQARCRLLALTHGLTCLSSLPLPSAASKLQSTAARARTNGTEGVYRNIPAEFRQAALFSKTVRQRRVPAPLALPYSKIVELPRGNGNYSRVLAIRFALYRAGAMERGCPLPGDALTRSTDRRVPPPVRGLLPPAEERGGRHPTRKSDSWRNASAKVN
jgi:hypothetical protein